MADIMVTLKDIEDLFWLATAKMLGYDPAITATSQRVRISWQQRGVPAWGIDEDVTFIRIGEKEDLFNVIRDYIQYQQDADTARVANAYTRIIDVKWTCYGPNSYDNASKIRSRLFMESYRGDLTAKDVYLVPDVKSPQRAPENFEGQWWDRSDLNAHFNNLVSLDELIPYFKSADIKINSTTSASVDSTTVARKE